MPDAPKGLSIFREASADAHLSEAQAKDLIGLYGIATPRRAPAADLPGARAAFALMRSPVAIKVISGSVHKTEIGGVELDIRDGAGVDLAVSKIERAASLAGVEVRGFLVEEMAPPGVEMLVGGVIDPTFGPAVMLGLGGVYAELFDDVTARICPITRDDAMEMMREIKAAPLLFGARGKAAADVDALADIVVAIGGETGLLMEHADRLLELDLNPVIVSPAGAVAVDARVILRK